jgi:hypothetical protein
MWFAQKESAVYGREWTSLLYHRLPFYLLHSSSASTKYRNLMVGNVVTDS